jgi:GH15 family glucan-1,4-alpha-glucosidase
LVRFVVGRRGEVALRMDLALRFDYGRVVPWVRRIDDNCLRAVAGPHSAILSTPIDHHGEDLSTIAEFTIRAGDRVPFVLTYEASHLPYPRKVDAETALRDTEAVWREWSGKCVYQGDWPEEVTRSLITIKALTYGPTGATVAAPTTSLPERVGGSRNWDYRFCWLRDAAFAILSLVNAGYRKEAEGWADWLLRAVAGSAEQVQPVYGVGAEHRLDERELGWLPGYRDSQPVRVGNAAYPQLQIDVFGNVMDALHEARHFGLELHEAGWGLQREMLRHLEGLWQKPDEGIWEVRGERQHFVHSKMLAWVAFDRAIASAERFGFDGPLERWRTLRDTIHAEVCEKGFSERRGAFVQTYGSEALDAAVLLMPIVGFLPPDDPRVVSTTKVIERELTRDGLVLRYDTEESDDGLEGEEGAFLACSFWLVDSMILQGRREEARELFERLLSLSNDVGLLAEQYDWNEGCFVGNFPQAFSHFALVDAAFNFAGERGSAREAHEHGLTSSATRGGG